MPSPASWLDQATRYLFFTGKGGVGKTTLACATALDLADRGRRVLIISTDPASNLDEMLGAQLTETPTAIPGALGLWAANIEPNEAAEGYRKRVLTPLEGKASAEELASIREQLSGACTTEIATFDHFAGLLAGEGYGASFDHIVFDTAPTGHTLRLLQLSRAWTGFLASNTRGASCLGPHSALTTRQELFETARMRLEDASLCTFVLVARPETAALQEAARTAQELRSLGLQNQRLALNGIFHSAEAGDDVAQAIERREHEALSAMPDALRSLERTEVPLRAHEMLGLEALRAVYSPVEPLPRAPRPPPATLAPFPSVAELATELAEKPTGLVMVMGKGGVGKTTLACALALELARRGLKVHLSTTDPAAHLTATLDGALPALEVSRIDPLVETRAYTERVMERKGKGMTPEERDLLREDLRSPCTEEVAVFSAFSHLVSLASDRLVILDTAPTGHTLLLLDATGAYHRDIVSNTAGATGFKVKTPLMRLKDPDYTRIILVTLPETTPVSEASALQEDLRRAGIEPWAWVVNESLAATTTRDPLLHSRMAIETTQLERIRRLAHRVAIVPWQPRPPRGLAALGELIARPANPRQPQGPPQERFADGATRDPR